MAIRKRELATILTTRDRMKKGLNSARRRLKKFEAGANKAALRAGAVIGAGIAAGITMAARKFLLLDAAMTRSVAIMKDVNTDMRKEMQMTARILSQEVLFSADKLAEGYFFLASAGKSASQSQMLLGDVAMFAQAGQFDLATATTLLADSQKALGLSSKNLMEDQREMVRVSDVLVKANVLANANVEQFSTALTTDAAPAMRAFNIELEEGVGLLAAYADQGIKGEKAGSMLGRFLRLLVPAAGKNAQAFEDLNIRVFDTGGNLRNMAGILRDMEKAFAKMSTRQRSAALESLGFQKKMQGAIFPLIGASKRVAEYEEELRKAGGTTQEVADKQLNSINSQWKLLTNNISESIAELLNFEDRTNSLVKAMKKLNRFFREDMREWVDTIRIMTIEAKFGILQTMNLFGNLSDNFLTIGNDVRRNLTNLFNFTVKLTANAITIFETMFKAVMKDTFKNLKSSFLRMGKFIHDPRQWTKGIDFEALTFGDTKTAMKVLKAVGMFDSPKLVLSLTKLRDLSQEIKDLDLSKQAEIDEFVRNRIAALFGKKIKLEGGEKNSIQKQITEALKTPLKIETSVVTAVEKGTAEALKLEHTRARKEDKIEKNTKRTADGVKKVATIISGMARKTGVDQIQLQDAFSG